MTKSERSQVISEWRRAIGGWVRGHQEQVLASALAVGLFVALSLSLQPARWSVEAQAHEWLNSLQAPQTDGEPPTVSHLKAPTPENQRLLKQLDEVRRRLRFHGEVAAFFYSRYYLALTVASVAGLLAGAMLLTIARIGWERAGLLTKVTFVIAAAAAAYFAAFPRMFQQAENITANVSLLVAYGNVQNEILSFLATGEDVNGKPQEAHAFVHVLDLRLAALHKVPIGFDASQLPSSIEAFKGALP